MTISQVKPGQEFFVKQVLLQRELGKRLADMGFTRGARGRVLRRGILGGPLQIQILGYELAIRVSEAQGIQVELLVS